MRKVQFIFIALIVLFSITTVGFSQSPTPQPTPPDDDINITTEEIKLNISAVTNNGKMATGLKSEDLVVMENGRLHQANSVRKIPANVLFLLDVGNEVSYAKRTKITATTARNLVNALHVNDSIAVMQYGDKVEVLSDWTKDKASLNKILGNTKLGFGRYSRFNLAMKKAIDFFYKTPLENRHLILITDGIDSLDNNKTKDSVTKRLLASDINVHVISYTYLQTQSLKRAKKSSVGKIRRRPSFPGIGLPDYQRPTVGGSVSINMDREMIRHRKKQMKRVLDSEEYLRTLAENTNGEIFLPETSDEMMDKMGRIASHIDSQYVVTYTPKNPLADAKDGEVRNIKVTSKKSGVYVQSYRKYIVAKEK